MKLLASLFFAFALSISFCNAQDDNENSMIIFAFNVDNDYKKTDMGYLIERGYDDKDTIEKRLKERIKAKFKANKTGGLGTDGTSNRGSNDYHYGPHLVVIKVNGERPELQTKSIGLVYAAGYGKTREEALTKAIDFLRRRAGISYLEELDFYTVVEEKVFQTE